VIKSKFVCQNCGASAPKWLGRCPGCGAYDTMVEEAVVTSRGKKPKNFKKVKPQPLSKIPLSREVRSNMGMDELDRVLGGGFVKGSLVLLGGDPGIGKSTLMLQISGLLAQTGKKILYVNGEESAYQVRMRAERINIAEHGISIVNTTQLESIIECADGFAPDLMVVDSIQTIYGLRISSAPGSVAQVRECGGELMRYAKEKGVTVVLIGHVTKFGAIAGPKTLEHMVDAVLYFEGDRNQQYRIIRAIKNRFGPTNEIGVFEMTGSGLKEVQNPSHLFISDGRYSGAVTVAVIEGSRPLLVEVQALTSPTFYNFPQRVATGIDYKRLPMLLAVLERRAGIGVYNYDCFVNAVGGIKILETSNDLGIIIAIASSVKDIAVDKHTLILGEVGLGGEIRSVYGILPRLKEAEKMGFERAVVPKHNMRQDRIKMKIVGVSSVKEAVELTLNE
jgi:DNA repair protein RadA/Sms